MSRAAITDPNTLDIGGKAVHMRERLPLKLGHKLPAMMAACNDGDFNTQLVIARLLIESWDFSGDPSDPAAYEEMDTLSEVFPLMEAILTWITKRMGHDPKARALVNGSTSP